MPNQFQSNGGQPQKPTKYTPIFTARFFQGLVTNRSPLRMGNMTWIYEKYYGGQNDALIAGLNTEISNKLTLVRRPGNPVYTDPIGGATSATFDNVDRFEEFKLFGPVSEDIAVMVDEDGGSLWTGLDATGTKAPFGDLKTLVWQKSSGAAQTTMQSVGNSLFFGNQVDQKKWLMSITTRPGNNLVLNNAQYPFMETFIVDPNFNIQQLIATALTISNVTVAGDGVTVTLKVTAGQITSSGIVAGTGTNGSLVFLQGLTSPFTDLNNTFGYVTTATEGSPGTLVVVLLPQYAASPHAAAANVGLSVMVNGGTPKTGGTPTWATVALTPSTVWPYPANVLTIDGTAMWICRSKATGSQAEGIFNWGIVGPTGPLAAPSTNNGNGAWRVHTFYSLDGVIVDSNGNLQSVTGEGQSGTAEPTWATVVGNTTTDGTVTWTVLQTAASMVWAAHTAYAPGHFILAPAGGQSCLFKLTSVEAATIIQQPSSAQPNTTTGDYVNLYYYGFSAGSTHSFIPFPAVAGAADDHEKVQSLLFNIPATPTAPDVRPMVNFALNQAGEIVSSSVPYANATQHYCMVALCSIDIPVAGQYSIVIGADDGIYFGIDGGAQLISGINFGGPSQTTGGCHTTTAMNGYPTMGGFDSNLNGRSPSNTWVVNFPTAGVYNMEFDFLQFVDNQTFQVQIQSYSPIPIANSTSLESMATQPVWPAWTTANAPGYPSVTESGSYASPNGTYSPTGGALTWENHGPAADFVWKASENFTTADSFILDSNGNQQGPYRTGYTGTQTPTWATALNALTLDNPNLIWINQGPGQAPAPGSLPIIRVGWQYGVALVNTLDDTVSNMSQLSASTGPFVGADFVQLPPGFGLPPAAKIDPQADWVAIYRTTDGGGTPFLVPGLGNGIYTLPLSEYLANGYQDDTPDTGLNNQLSGAQAGENTPPAAGAINQAYHLNRIFYSIGNVVYWTSGPDTPSGNGLNGSAPLNFSEVPSLVKRLVPTSIGLFVFTISDIYLIPGQGTSTNPIQAAQPYLPGVGILSYNALSECGTIIGIFTTDSTFMMISPGAGFQDAGYSIGNLFRSQNPDLVGQNFVPKNVYAAWHVNGEDQAWYVADGATGWYRGCSTPAPESGSSWSPFAQIVGGVRAVQSIEVQPGIHKLLLGPTGVGEVLARDSDVFTDGDQTYFANAVMGSIVLANPGQVAAINFLTTDSVRIGSPLTLGVIMDEALPYFNGKFDLLREWTTDPTEKPKSRSILGQRFYVGDNPDITAVCRHMQIAVDWLAEDVQNELLTMTIFGAFFQEG